jgi:hypothetical protein
MEKLIIYSIHILLSFVVLGSTSIYAENTIESLSANNDQGAFTFELNGDFSNGDRSHVRFFIDSDNNPDTGYSDRHITGADYRVKDNKFYEFNGTNWTKINSTINTYKQNDYISSEIPLSLLGSSDTISFTAVVMDSNWDNWQIYDGMFTYTLDQSPSVVPYDLVKFQSVLDQSKLQWPQSGTEVDYGAFQGFHADHFYLSNDGYMTFETENSGTKRVELREGPQEWFTSTRALKHIVGEVKCFYPDTIKEYTWMQIHDNKNSGVGGINKPLVRLAWIKEKKDNAGHLLTDYLWAVIRDTNSKNGPSTWYPLIQRPNSFFKAEISVHNNQLYVYINDILKHQRSVAYWDVFLNYFKAGVYLSGSVNNDVPEGQKTAKVQFKTLSY